MSFHKQDLIRHDKTEMIIARVSIPLNLCVSILSHDCHALKLISEKHVEVSKANWLQATMEKKFSKQCKK